MAHGEQAGEGVGVLRFEDEDVFFVGNAGDDGLLLGCGLFLNVVAERLVAVEAEAVVGVAADVVGNEEFYAGSDGGDLLCEGGARSNWRRAASRCYGAGRRAGP